MSLWSACGTAVATFALEAKLPILISQPFINLKITPKTLIQLLNDTIQTLASCESKTGFVRRVSRCE